MNSSKFSLYSPTLFLAFSIAMAIVVVGNLILNFALFQLDYNLDTNSYRYEQSRADFQQNYGNWSRDRQTLYAGFLIPPIIGFILAIFLRRYVKNLILRNEGYFRKEFRRRLTKWEGIGLDDLRKDMSILPRFLPLLTVIILLFVLDFLVFPDTSTSCTAFLATCGFTSYGTWKKIFTDAMSFEESD